MSAFENNGYFTLEQNHSALDLLCIKACNRRIRQVASITRSCLFTGREQDHLVVAHGWLKSGPVLENKLGQGTYGRSWTIPPFRIPPEALGESSKTWVLMIK